ncbi:hypothetical protein [Paenibacillus durus]|uniref:hypothetical protein n=1 Tax=Paenibacillus durus TaxID=44251 RepID=UPI0012E0A314|nr:hypothetical protein [Paenibacillus durus]
MAANRLFTWNLRFPANLQVFPVDIVWEEEMAAIVQPLDACTLRRGEWLRNACTFAGIGFGRGSYEKKDVHMQSFFATFRRCRPPYLKGDRLCKKTTRSGVSSRIRVILNCRLIIRLTP